MLYRKVRVSHLDDKKRLYRVLYVPENLRLSDFASIILDTFHMSEGHLYEFRKGRISYTAKRDDDYFGDFDDYGDYDMSEYTIHDPGNTYRFIYDYGDDWEFEVRIYKATKEFGEAEPAYVIEGKGQGIWEDNRWGYMRLLSGEIPGSQSEDDEEKEFYMPWNLNLEKAEDTFKAIDPEYETELLSSSVSMGEYEDEEDGDIWEHFNDIYEDADMCFMDDDCDGSPWIRAFEEFKKVCEELKEEGKLPAKFSEISDMYPDFEGDPLIEDLADELPDYQRFDELWQIMDELEQMFETDEFTEEEIIRGKAEALHGLGRNDEMLSYVREKYEIDPQNDTIRMLMLDAFRYCRKKKDGKQLLEEILKSEPECNEDNYAFYHAALAFARYAGMKALAKKLEASITKEDERQVNEMEEEFGFLDDEYPDYDDEDLDESYTIHMLRQAIQMYKETPDEANFRKLIMPFGMLMMEEGMIYITADTEGSTKGRAQLRMYVDPETNETLMPLFTEDLGKLPPEMTLFKVPVTGITRFVIENRIDGILLDTYPDDDSNAVVPREILEHLVAVTEIMDDDPDGVEPDDDFDDDFDDDIPF